MGEIRINKLSTRQFLILLAVIVLIGAAAIFSLTSGKSKTLATVDGKKITEADLYEVLEERFGKIELGVLIEEKVIDLELKKANKEISKAEIDEEVKRYREAFGGEEQLKTTIAMQGMTLSDFEKNVKRSLALDALFGEDVEVTDEEMEAYYEENKAAFFDEAEAETHVILVEDKPQAEEIIANLKDGGDFAALAKEHSKHASAEAGGAVGFVAADVLPEALAKVTFALKEDEISDPVQTEAGYHVIKVTDKKDAKQGTLEESTKTIENTLANEKIQEAFRPWYNEKIKEYKVKNNLDK